MNMNSNGFLYILRYALEPGHHEEERFEELVLFCRKAGIDDVMFFINCEELNRGHFTMEETIPWMEMIARGKAILEPYGITTSINPWITLLHTDRGKTLKEGQEFNLMVDPYGNTAAAVVCPLCPEWRKYIAGMYAFYAEVKPFMIWVEDDFRLHNHDPLKWGGCFCERHMDVFSEKAGKKLTRGEFAEGLLKPGEPHPYRKIWLETSRAQMTELAKLIGDAVHRVSPATKVGLMSSSPAVHCAEGRNWEGILKGLSGDASMVVRPHLPSYTETTAQSYLWNFSAVSMLTRASVPPGTEFYPELELFPFTRFSKSKSFARFQIETSLCLDSRGITMNMFDMMGNGVMLREGYQDMLAGCREFISAVNGLGIDAGNQDGVRVLFSPDSSFTLHTLHGTDMSELYPGERFWSGLLSCYGIANVYSCEKKFGQNAVAVSGQYFRNMNEYELKDLFADNYVILDGEASDTLLDMGYGYLAGMAGAKWHLQNSGFQSYEQVCDGKIYCGLKDARVSLQNSAGDYIEIEYMREPSIKTVAKNASGQTLGAGVAEYDHRVLILPYGHFGDGMYGIQCHLSPVRQEMLQGILKNNEICRCPVFISGNPYIHVCHYRKSDSEILVIYNASGDDLDEISIHSTGWDAGRVYELNRDTLQPVKADTVSGGDGCMVLKSGLKRMELKALTYGIF